MKNNLIFQDPLEGRILPASAREDAEHQHPDPAAEGGQVVLQKVPSEGL